MPGFKAAKSRLIVLLSGNASDDLSLKRLLVVYSKNLTSQRPHFLLCGSLTRKLGSPFSSLKTSSSTFSSWNRRTAAIKKNELQ
ncbi:hypothetical protein E2320_005427, partial [Naja naja]